MNNSRESPEDLAHTGHNVSTTRCDWGMVWECDNNVFFYVVCTFCIVVWARGVEPQPRGRYVKLNFKRNIVARQGGHIPRRLLWKYNITAACAVDREFFFCFVSDCLN